MIEMRLNRKRQSGQSAVEMLIALPLLLMIIFGLVQWSFISRSKITLNTSTELAARAGALNYGNPGAMNRAFYHAMLPLFMQGKASLVGIVQANTRARIAAGLRSRLTVLNPSAAVLKEYRKRTIYPLENRFYDEIPNDNLMYRPSTKKTIDGGIQMNIQDANLLKIKIEWCEELVVPVIGKLFVSWASGIVPSAAQLRCNAVGRARGMDLLAMQSVATYRMQTPYRN
jgi:TadE-like protein